MNGCLNYDARDVKTKHFQHRTFVAIRHCQYATYVPTHSLVFVLPHPNPSPIDFRPNAMFSFSPIAHNRSKRAVYYRGTKPEVSIYET